LKKRQTIRIREDLRKALSRYLDLTNDSFTGVVHDALWLYLEVRNEGSQDVERQADRFLEPYMTLSQAAHVKQDGKADSAGDSSRSGGQVEETGQGLERARSALADFDID